jgi:hypothetical protein
MLSLRLPIRRFSLVSILSFAALLFIAAAPRANALGPHGDLYAGYSRLWDSTTGNNGWQVDGHIKVAPFLGAEAGVSGYSDSGGGNTYLYLFGPRATVSVRRTHLFAHFLIGGNHASGFNEFIYAVGGGVDIGLIPHLGWRFAGDGLREPSASAGAGQFTTGPVLRF